MHSTLWNSWKCVCFSADHTAELGLVPRARLACVQGLYTPQVLAQVRAGLIEPGQSPEEQAVIHALTDDDIKAMLTQGQAEGSCKSLDLLGTSTAQQHAQNWFAERSLEIPGYAMSSSLLQPRSGPPKGIAFRVNPTVWPAKPPFVLEAGGGLLLPFEYLHNFASSPDLAAARGTTPKAEEADAKHSGSVAHVAVRVFSCMAKSMRRLLAADALEVVLDCGDVMTAPRRLRMHMQTCAGGSEGSGAGTGDDEAHAFERIHVSNIPDYVRPHT
jgi:hypothetical protein